MSHRNPPSTGEERAASERQSIYHDPNLRKQKRAESRALIDRFNDLCGEVTVTRVAPKTKEIRDTMTETINCPDCAGTVMGVVIPGVMDGVLFWTCMDCGQPFHRWPEGHSLHDKAQPFIRDIERHRADGTPSVDPVAEAWGRTS